MRAIDRATVLVARASAFGPKYGRTMSTPPPCWLYGLLAQEAAVAVLFRRGPPEDVQLIRWDTANDTFEVGQWFRGPFFEERSDLSPDGRLLVYFAGRPALWQHTWTAVSRPPFLAPLARWHIGGIWFGGGVFVGQRSLAINYSGHPKMYRGGALDRYSLAGLPGGSLPLIVTRVNMQPYVQGVPQADGVGVARAARDGWRVAQEAVVTPSTKMNRVPVMLAPRVVEKPSGLFTLRRTERLDQYSWSRTYVLDGATLDLAGVEWADWDQHERLVFARAGQLYASPPGDLARGSVTLLADFRANSFKRVLAPDWARAWPN